MYFIESYHLVKDNKKVFIIKKNVNKMKIKDVWMRSTIKRGHILLMKKKKYNTLLMNGTRNMLKNSLRASL